MSFIRIFNLIHIITQSLGARLTCDSTERQLFYDSGASFSDDTQSLWTFHDGGDPTSLVATSPQDSPSCFNSYCMHISGSNNQSSLSPNVVSRAIRTIGFTDIKVYYAVSGYSTDTKTIQRLDSEYGICTTCYTVDGEETFDPIHTTHSQSHEKGAVQPEKVVVHADLPNITWNIGSLQLRLNAEASNIHSRFGCYYDEVLVCGQPAPRPRNVRSRGFRSNSRNFRGRR
eukprot:56710_1